MRPPRASVRLAAALALCLAVPAAAAEPPSLRPNPAAVLPPPRCSIPRVQDWREYRSEHFVLSTDVSRAHAAELVEELERLHALVVAALFGPDVEVPGSVHVVAFASPGQFEEVAPAHAGGYVTETAWDPAIVFAFEGRERSGEIIAHEIAHHVAWHHFPRQPAWFSEGLAMFVQSVGVRRSDDEQAPTGSHVVHGAREHGGRWAGFPSPELASLVRGSLTVGPKELLEWRGRPDDGDPGRFHARSWLLYHYLWNKRSKAFTDYQERLASGADPAAAWRAAFADLDPASDAAMARLEDELVQYRRTGRYASYRVDVGPVGASFQDAPIGSADLHMLLSGIRDESRWPRDAAERKAAERAIVEEALREDPAQPEALVERAVDGGGSVVDALRRATAAHPGDFRAWYLLGNALDEKAQAAEKEQALRKAAALAPSNAHANNALAWFLVSAGRPRDARPFAERALDVEPWNRAVVDTLAAVAFGIGQCRPALVLQRRAADLYAPDDKAGDGVRKRLAEYEAKCGGAVAPASAPAR